MVESDSTGRLDPRPDAPNCCNTLDDVLIGGVVTVFEAFDPFDFFCTNVDFGVLGGITGEESRPD